MSPKSLELGKNVFEVSGVALLLLTFFAGAGVLWFSRKVNEAQAEQLRQFDKGLTDAKERVANAELRTAELLARIQPRYFTEQQIDQLSKNLPGLAGYTLLIGSLRYDGESALLAKQIKSVFNRRQVGLGADSIDRIGAYPGIQLGALFGGGETFPPEIRIGIEVWSSDPKIAGLIARDLMAIGKLAVSTPPLSQYPFGGIPERFMAIFVGAKPILETK
jgi:hypothetical protein